MKAMATLGNASRPLSASESISETRIGEAGGESTIGEMAAEFGVSLRTLRFYEDRQMLRPRREGHTRLYGQSDRLRMQMIVKGKRLGFTLGEIAELIGTQDVADDIEGKLRPSQIVTQIDHLERQRREIDDAIARLRATHDRLATASRRGEPQTTSAF
jgi:DNA-binding transcriptional MerR regulator